METLEGLSKKMPVRVVQRLQKPIPLEVIAAQLHLNGWLDEQLVDRLLGNAKECVVTVFQTDYGLEASVSGKIGEYPEQKTEFPGFYVAPTASELTIPLELKRAVNFIGRKYIPRIGGITKQPVRAHLDKITPVGKDHVIAHFSYEPLDVKTEDEYWHSYIEPNLTDTFDEGKAVHIVHEAYTHHANNARAQHSDESAWARNMTAYSLYSLLNMLSEHGRKHVSVKKYKTENGIYKIDNVEFLAFYNPDIQRQLAAGQASALVKVSKLEKIQ